MQVLCTGGGNVGARPGLSVLKIEWVVVMAVMRAQIHVMH